MSIDLKHPDYIDLRRRIREDPKGFVAIIGAGLPRIAGLPSWPELRDHVASQAKARVADIPDDERDGYLKGLARIEKMPDLWGSFTELHRLMPTMAYEEAIRQRLTLKPGHKAPQAYELIWRLGIKGVLTFNIDACAANSFSCVFRAAVDTATAKDTECFPQFFTSGSPFLFQPHGTLNDRSTWVFTHKERDRLLGTQAYVDFMQTLCQAMHLLIVGFNPSDFAFTYLIQKAITGRSSTGSKHYILLPSPDSDLLRQLSDKGFAVIPYRPNDPDSHLEVEEALKDILAFLPTDGIAATVYTGPQTDPASLPSDDELLTRPLHDVRKLLNGAVATILPPGSHPTEDDVDKLEAFYSEHLRAIHMAWLIEPNSGCDLIHGYRVMSYKGRGAFGQVYEAEHTITAERAAIKVLLPEVRHSREYLNSFRRGVRSMRILTDHRIARMVHLIDAFEVPACIVMDYVDGPTLTEAVNWGNLEDLGVALQVLVQVGEVVHAAHNLDELVLHRDLKPDNVILRNGFNRGDPPDVVVVDFDLSWHKGALELSVVHGARAQGYAAPEQTATGRLKGMSTRNTAVDAFGYGMLGFFVFVGTDPRPNEQNFDGFEEKVRAAIQKRFSCHWHALPPFLANIVRECTREDQASRLAFASALAAFRNAQQMASADTVKGTDPLLLEEISALILPESIPERSDFGRCLRTVGPDPSKSTKLSLEGDGDQVFVAVEMTKIRAAGDDRNVAKYLDKARDRAVARFKKHPFVDVRGEIGQSRLSLSGCWPVGKTVTLKEISEVARIIIDARSQMELG